jgi:hypothetical protein
MGNTGCRDSQEVAGVRSLEELVLTDAAEQAAEKPLDREFTDCAARSRSVPFTSKTVTQTKDTAQRKDVG